jgi:hypothetical protein
MRRILTAAIGLAVVAVMASAARAEDNPTGTWKWEQKGNNQSREVTLKLKLDSGKLTGTISGRNADTEISDGTFKDGEIAFSVTRERNGNKFTTKYSGKLSGDSIKGKAESERNGQTTSRDWEATRAKE